MHLHTDEKIFGELIIATAQSKEGLVNHQVEKDYYVSLFLKELINQNIEMDIVFKGGTSLSKCFDVIDRFSEDIDLTINFNNMKAGHGLRKLLKESILKTVNNLGFSLINAQDIRSNRDFNIYVIEFPKLFKTTAETVPFLIIETMVAYKPYPVTNKKVNSFLLNYLMSFTEGQTLIKKYELFPFTMLVQTMERTFIDKLFALCDYHLRQNYDRYSRHLYDIHMMWTSEQLDKEKLMFIIPDIIAARQRFPKQNLSALPNSKPKTLLMEIIKTAVFKNDYNNVTLNLIHKKVNYEPCISSLNTIINANLLPEVIIEYL